MIDEESIKKTIIGFVSGLAEVCVTQPFWSIKLQKQSISPGPIDFSPRQLYRGTGFNFAGFSGTIAVQMGIYDALVRNCELENDIQKGAASLFSGIASSLIASPTEMLMTQQHALSASPLTTASHVFKENGLKYAYRGLTASAVQESITSSFLFFLGPMIKAELQDTIPDKELLSFTAGSIAGAGAAFFSQPANTVRAIQQKATEPLSFFDATKLIHDKHGIPGFYQGTLARIKMIVLSMGVLMLVKDKLVETYCEDESMGSDTIATKYTN